MYKLTEVTDVTNTGHNQTVTEFDTFDELQDHIINATSGMTDDEAELYHYQLRVEEL